MTKYNFKKISRSQIGWEQYKDRLLEEERQQMRKVAEHLDIDPDAEDLAKRIGWGKTLEEKFEEFEPQVNGGWVMKKPRKEMYLYQLERSSLAHRRTKKPGETQLRANPNFS